MFLKKISHPNYYIEMIGDTQTMENIAETNDTTNKTNIEVQAPKQTVRKQH